MTKDEALDLYKEKIGPLATDAPSNHGQLANAVICCMQAETLDEAEKALWKVVGGSALDIAWKLREDWVGPTFRNKRHGIPKPHKGECSLCGDEHEVFHLDLYVTGSEGVWVCLACRMVLTNVARGIRSTAGRVRGAVMLENKRARDT